jgi:hypothetical protein
MRMDGQSNSILFGMTAGCFDGGKKNAGKLAGV